MRKAGIIAFWLILWQAASLAVHNNIILVGPVEVVRVLAEQIVLAGSGSDYDFWRTIIHSFGKISIGFLAAFIAGILVGCIAYGFPFLKELLEPVMVFMKSVPVASFVILALIWIGSKNLSVFISFMVVFPMIYVNTIAGLSSTDPDLLEMASVFRMRKLKKAHYIYGPALMPYLISGCKLSLGMSWKSGVAAEVIGVPAHSIGEKLYMAKIYLNTADLFAWTLVIILISAGGEKLFLYLLNSVDKHFNRTNGKEGDLL